MKIADAKLCLDCDEVYTGAVCACGSTAGYPIIKWLNRPEEQIQGSNCGIRLVRRRVQNKPMMTHARRPGLRRGLLAVR